MSKEKFIRSTLILMIGGGITKLLGMFIRVVMTRLVGLDGIGLYMLIYPTFSLFMTLSQLSMPVAISKIVADDTHNNRRVVFSSIPVTLLFNIFLIILIILIAPVLANNFLKDSRAYLPILAIALVLPFDAISNLLRGYFFGKQMMLPHVISHIIEQIIRLVIVIVITPKLLAIGVIYAVAGLILVNLVSELLSIGILFFFLPRNFKITKSDIYPSKENIKDVLEIAIPTTGGRLVGSIGYFLEPILLTSALLLVGYSNSYIVTEYGIISGYVMPLLLMPAFFSGAISNALLPVIAKSYAKKEYSYIKTKIKQAIIFSLGIGVPYTIILVIFPEFFLHTFYHTSHGATYLRYLAPVFLLYYIQSPLAAALQSMNKSKQMMYDNIKGIIAKTILLFLCSLLKIGMLPLVIATSVSIFITTLSHAKHVKYILKYKKQE